MSVPWTGWLLHLCLHRTGSGKSQHLDDNADLSCSAHILTGTISFRLPPFGKTIRHHRRLPTPYPVPTVHKARPSHHVSSRRISRTHHSLVQSSRLDQPLFPCRPRSALLELLHLGWWPRTRLIPSRACARHAGTVGHDPPGQYVDSVCSTPCILLLLLHACHRGHNLPILVWFHSYHGYGRLFIAEALGVFVFQWIVRHMGVNSLAPTSSNSCSGSSATCQALSRGCLITFREPG